MTAEGSAFDVRRAGVLLHVTSLPAGLAGRDVRPARRRGLPVRRLPRRGRLHGLAGAAAGADARGEPVAVQRAVLDGRQPRADQPRAPVRPRPRRTRRRWTTQQRSAFASWCAEQRDWLEPYVEFIALRELHGHAPWPTWEPRAAGPRPGAPSRRRSHRSPTGCRRCASSSGSSPGSGRELREYAARRGVLLFGDLPIFVSLDSADVWASRELFRLDADGRPITVTGVPAGLLRRGRPALEQPALRLGRDGRRRVRLVAAPDRPPARAVRPRPDRPLPRLRGRLARAGRRAHRQGRLVGRRAGARDPVRAGRHRRARDPGRRGPRRDHARGRGAARPVRAARDEGAAVRVRRRPRQPLPARATTASTASSTPAPTTTTPPSGWWSTLDEETRDRVRSHLVDPDEPMPWALVRLALASTARLAVVPAQDLLGLGSEARMNTPGTDEGNWGWQAPEGPSTPSSRPGCTGSWTRRTG